MLVFVDLLNELSGSRTYLALRISRDGLLNIAEDGASCSG